MMSTDCPASFPSAAAALLRDGTLRAITLDLDDTLWPVGPTLVRAEQVLHDWLRAQAPATAAAFGVERMLALRQDVARRRPDLAHDLTALRRITLREALAAAGDGVHLADPAFEVFFAARQQVTWYEDVAEALARLGARFVLYGLTNGNAELGPTGLSAHLAGVIGARECGVAKPDARIFQAACARLGLAPHQVLHVGDDWALDVVGARRAGLHSAWVRRPDAAHRPGPAHGRPDDEAPGQHLTVPDLGRLADALGA
ncbi:MAG: hypothetical protein RLZZ592_203 [Pseudomonadota bacterium]|jgi:putative hydrolase of the HAD superfamily